MGKKREPNRKKMNNLLFFIVHLDLEKTRYNHIHGQTKHILSITSAPKRRQTTTTKTFSCIIFFILFFFQFFVVHFLLIRPFHCIIHLQNEYVYRFAAFKIDFEMRNEYLRTLFRWHTIFESFMQFHFSFFLSSSNSIEYYS